MVWSSSVGRTTGVTSWIRPFDLLGVRCPDATFCNGNRYIVAQVSILYRFPSFVHVASMAGTAIDIENRAGCANKRPYHSLVTTNILTMGPTQCDALDGSERVGAL